MNKNKLIILPLSFIFFCLLGINQTFAFDIYTKDSTASILDGDTYEINLFIDTKDQEINVLEGGLKITGPAEISSINIDRSIFSMWAESPKLVDNNQIFFAGGVEGGVYGRDLKILSFSIKPKHDGSITIKPVGFSMYLNDGLGTKIDNNSKDAILVINKNSTNSTYIMLVVILGLVLLFTFVNILNKLRKNK